MLLFIRKKKNELLLLVKINLHDKRKKKKLDTGNFYIENGRKRKYLYAYYFEKES